MAKIHEEIIVIKLSKLVKDSDNTTPLASDDIIAGLEQVTQELIGDTVIVEVERT